MDRAWVSSGIGIEPLQQLGDVQWARYQVGDQAGEVQLRPSGALGEFAGAQQAGQPVGAQEAHRLQGQSQMRRVGGELTADAAPRAAAR
ncbi:MAG: hypothetical protein M3Y48_18230 [Actinomycetota bacterium]|nr:hypothetical protein [Actinomycetota bacterium]